MSSIYHFKEFHRILSTPLTSVASGCSKSETLLKCYQCAQIRTPEHDCYRAPRLLPIQTCAEEERYCATIITRENSEFMFIHFNAHSNKISQQKPNQCNYRLTVIAFIGYRLLLDRFPSDPIRQTAMRHGFGRHLPRLAEIQSPVSRMVRETSLKEITL